MGRRNNEDERIRDLELSRALHARQLADHDGVLKDLRDHLGKIVDRLASLERKAFIVTLLIVGGDQAKSIFLG